MDRIPIAVFIAMTLAALGSRPTSAATFTVTSSIDAYDGVCGSKCSLRDAIAAANRAAGADTVVVPAGDYLLARPPTVADAPTGDLDIYDEVTIVGAGRDRTVIDGGGIDRIVEVHGGAVTLFSGMTLRNGSALVGGGMRVQTAGTLTIERCELSGNASMEHGGAVYNDGTTTIRNSSLSGNSALGFGSGGGVYNSTSATLTLDKSIVTGNSARNGVGIYNEGAVTLTDCTLSNGNARDIGVGGGLFNLGTATLTRCTLNDNAAFGGAGVFNRASAFLILESSTLSTNTVSGFGRGGGLYNRGMAAVTNCTFWANSAVGGAGIFTRGTTTLANTIVANSLLGPSCAGAVTSAGHNLNDDGTCGLTATGDLSGVPADLTPLADYGGPTRTHALCRGPSLPLPDCTRASAAIDAGDDLECRETDQRGAPRFGGSACDIGAFESGVEPPVACHGDCGGDGTVTVDELAQAIDIALGNTPLTVCPLLDVNGDAITTVDEILVAVTSAIGGCSSQIDLRL